MDVRRGVISKRGFHAERYRGNEAALRGRIVVQRAGTGGLIEFPDLKQFVTLARDERIPEAAVAKAFGHAVRRNPGSDRPEAMPGATPHYGRSRRVKIGHFEKTGPQPDIRRGQIVLYDGPSKLIHFALFEIDEGKNRGKLKTAEGRSISLSSGLNKARNLGIPLQALLQAFGHMLPVEARRELAGSVRR